MTEQRYLTKYVLEDLTDKMVFIGGPRQVGKTTLAQELVSNHFQQSGYYNWDNRQDRRNIMQSNWPGDAELIILDEIHKYKKWKSLVKGEYDKLKDKYSFLITGSARLDLYRKGGDSMLGRYHFYRLHPLYYLRSIEKKEVDFLVTVDKKPWFTVEVKINNVNASPHLFYFRDKLKIPFSYQVVKQNGVDSFTNGVRIVSANNFLAGLV